MTDELSRRTWLRAAAGGLAGAAILGAASAVPAHGLTQTWGRVNGRMFKRNLYQLLDVPTERLPYNTPTSTPLERDVNYLDQDGVTRTLTNGELIYNPVTIAKYSLERLNSFRLLGDTDHLAAAIVNVEHLISMAVLTRGALYLPYNYRFDLHQWRLYYMEPTWWSGMAQGQALSATMRLWELTRDRKYLDFARGLYQSFLNWPERGAPWTVSVGDDDCYWIEEYPRDEGSCLALNGHNFGIYGLYDFWRVTKSTQAMYLIQGALTATVTRVHASLRNPGRPSYYCNHLDFRATRYHKIHIDQAYHFHGFTGDTGLAAVGDILLSDFPTSFDANRAVVNPGTYLACRFDVNLGDLLDSREIVVSTPESWPVGGVLRRRSMRGHEGVWLELGSGQLAGYWVREGPDSAFVRYIVDRHHFGRPRRIWFEAGTYIGYTLSSPRGDVVAQRQYSLPRPSAAHCDERAVVNGQLYYHVINGVWADRWIPAQDGVSVE
jgi:hypothetical protein